MGRSISRPRPRRRGAGCSGALFAILFVGALAALVYLLALRPFVSRAVADRIAGPAAPVPTLMPPAGPQPAPSELQATVEQQASEVLPAAVAALPQGELLVSEADVNDFLAANPAALAPIERASVDFTEGRALASIGAYGLSSTAAVSLAARDGRIAVTAAEISGPLALAISGDQLARSLAERLNAEFAAQGRRVDELRIEEDRLVLVTSGATR
ncbi:MAG: hypothetical protein OHK0015_21530 [Chloroflexi bacterium OHK40]